MAKKKLVDTVGIVHATDSDEMTRRLSKQAQGDYRAGWKAAMNQDAEDAIEEMQQEAHEEARRYLVEDLTRLFERFAKVPHFDYTDLLDCTAEAAAFILKTKYYREEFPGHDDNGRRRNFDEVIWRKQKEAKAAKAGK